MPFFICFSKRKKRNTQEISLKGKSYMDTYTITAVYKTL